MHICEQVVESVQYLEEHGFTKKQLSSLHHFSLTGKDVGFNSVKKYLGINKNLQDNNYNFANRIIYVASQYKNKKGSFLEVIEQALKKWPLSQQE